MSELTESMYLALQNAQAVFSNVQARYREWINRGSAAMHREDEIVPAFAELAKNGKEVRQLPDIGKLGYAFTVAWQRASMAIMAAPEDGFVPSGALWTAFDALEDFWLERSRKTLPPVESIEQLQALKEPVGPAQIARMYGWLKFDGEPDTERVLREIQKKPEDRVTPPNPQQARHDQEWAERAAAIDNVRQIRNSRIKSATVEGPEDWRELLLPVADGGQGVSARQIASIKRCTIAQVFAKADEMGLPRPPIDYSPGTAAPRPDAIKHQDIESYGAGQDDDTDLEGDDLVGDSEDITESSQIAEVLAYKAAGMPDAEIAQSMGITAREVKKLAKKGAEAIK